MNTRVNGVDCVKHGLELKVLTPEVFTMMVIMALVPLYDRTCFRFSNYLFKSKVVLMPKK
jgi:hypothetical protein